MGIESYHDTYQDAVVQSTLLYRTARRVFRRPNYPSRGDHWFIPVHVESFKGGYNGEKYPEGIRYTPYWD